MLSLRLGAMVASSVAQDRLSDWTPADHQTFPLEPAGVLTGRVCHSAAGGGNLHISIEARPPVTVAMAWADEWNNALERPDAFANRAFLCLKEPVVGIIYECHLPSERPMVLTIRDERKPEGPVVSAVGAIIVPGLSRVISPTELHIQYYRWSCVDNCIQPEFGWRRLVKEKYPVTPAPKIYSLLTPDHDQQELGVKIKSPIAMTVAVWPSPLADQVYDKPPRSPWPSTKPAAKNAACSR